MFAYAVDLSFFDWRRTHHADTLGHEALDRLRLAEHLAVNLEQRQAAEVRVEFPSGFGGVKLRSLHGAEISGSAERKTVAEVLVGRLSDGEHVARRLRHAARVEIAELQARIFHGGHCLRVSAYINARVLQLKRINATMLATAPLVWCQGSAPRAQRCKRLRPLATL